MGHQGGTECRPFAEDFAGRTAYDSSMNTTMKVGSFAQLVDPMSTPAGRASKTERLLHSTAPTVCRTKMKIESFSRFACARARVLARLVAPRASPLGTGEDEGAGEPRPRSHRLATTCASTASCASCRRHRPPPRIQSRVPGLRDDAHPSRALRRGTPAPHHASTACRTKWCSTACPRAASCSQRRRSSPVSRAADSSIRAGRRPVHASSGPRRRSVPASVGLCGVASGSAIHQLPAECPPPPGVRPSDSALSQCTGFSPTPKEIIHEQDHESGSRPRIQATPRDRGGAGAHAACRARSS